MIQVTAVQADILHRFTEGQAILEIAKVHGYVGNSIYAILRLLCNRGLLRKIKRGTFEPTGAKYEIAELKDSGPKPGMRHAREKQSVEFAPISTKVDPDVLEYIKAHYPLYQNKRGQLARKLGISKTVFNEIVIEHVLKKRGQSA